METAMKKYVKPIIKMHEVKLGDYLNNSKINENNRSSEYSIIYNIINNYNSIMKDSLPLAAK